jgi:hypothetical protein
MYVVGLRRAWHSTYQEEVMFAYLTMKLSMTDSFQAGKREHSVSVASLNRALSIAGDISVK